MTDDDRPDPEQTADDFYASLEAAGITFKNRRPWRESDPVTDPRRLGLGGSDPGDNDGGYGEGSYFDQAMQKDD